MGNKVSVSLIGLPDIEEKRMLSAFNHSKMRHTTYYRVTLENAPDILFVNADSPDALVQWRYYRGKLDVDNKLNPPTIVVSKNREFKTRHYQVRTPLITTRAISILDTVTEREIQHYEEEIAIVISSEDKTITEISNKIKFSALVVDDSLPVRIQMDKVLKELSANVDFAESGEEAFDYINTKDYNIIFLDIVLPGIDGYEVCKIAREGKAKDTPIIMLTGNSSPADKIKGKLSGCDTYLIKPVNPMIFQQVVSEFLKNSKAKIPA